MSFDEWKALAREVDEQERVDALKRGRRRFIWRERLLPIALPLGILMSGWAFHVLNYGWKDVFSLSGAAVLYFCVALGLVVGYVHASLEWKEMKNRKRKRQ